MRKLLLLTVFMFLIVVFVSCAQYFQRGQNKMAETTIESNSKSIVSTNIHNELMTDYNSNSFFQDTTFCNETTTAGMIEWSNRQQRLYTTKSKVIQQQLCEGNLNQRVMAEKDRLQFRKFIDKEIAYWQRLEETLMKFNIIAMDIQEIQNGGGSIYGIICADNQRELSYIRYACLLEDLAVLNATSPQKSSLKDNLCIDSLYIEMRKCRPSVPAHAIRENEDLSEHDAASRAKYLNEAYSFPVVKRGIENWLNARAQVANLLPPNYGVAYNNHTIRTLRSLIYLYRGMEQGV